MSFFLFFFERKDEHTFFLGRVREDGRCCVHFARSWRSTSALFVFKERCGILFRHEVIFVTSFIDKYYDNDEPLQGS